MNGMGARMKARARELGLSDTKVAERAGLAQTRYATYTIDKFEPDFGTLLRICRVLHVTPNDLLGWTEIEADSKIGVLQKHIIANLSVLEPDLLNIVDTITSALVNTANTTKERGESC